MGGYGDEFGGWGGVLGERTTVPAKQKGAQLGGDGVGFFFARTGRVLT
ncbi:hypothetical protein [Bartonella grahamii]|nr:hypothetical protein [Bartonella grahamii]